MDRIRTLAARLGWRGGLAILVVAALSGAALSQVLANRDSAAPGSGQFDRGEREAINEMVRAYILANPEVIPEAINRLQEREVVKLLDSNRDEIETPYAGAWAGAKSAGKWVSADSTG